MLKMHSRRRCGVQGHYQRPQCPRALIYSNQTGMRAIVILSAPSQELLPEGFSYFITPIKLINFKAIDKGSALLVSVLRSRFSVNCDVKTHE